MKKLNSKQEEYNERVEERYQAHQRMLKGARKGGKATAKKRKK